MTESDILAFNGNATSLCVTFAAKSILGDARNWANKNEAAKETVKNVELWHNLILNQQEKELRENMLSDLNSLPSFARKIFTNRSIFSQFTNNAIELNVRLLVDASIQLIDLDKKANKATHDEIVKWFDLMKSTGDKRNMPHIVELWTRENKRYHNQAGGPTRFHHMSLFIFITYMTKFSCGAEGMVTCSERKVQEWEIWSGCIYDFMPNKISSSNPRFGLMKLPVSNYHDDLEGGKIVNALELHKTLLKETMDKMYTSLDEKRASSDYEHLQVRRFYLSTHGTIALMQDKGTKHKIQGRKKVRKSYIKAKKKGGTYDKYQPRLCKMMPDKFLMGRMSLHFIFLENNFPWKSSSPQDS